MIINASTKKRAHWQCKSFRGKRTWKRDSNSRHLRITTKGETTNEKNTKRFLRLLLRGGFNFETVIVRESFADLAGVPPTVNPGVRSDIGRSSS